MAGVTNATDNALHISSVEIVPVGTNVQIIVTCPAERLMAFKQFSGDTNTTEVFVTKMADSAAQEQINQAATRAAIQARQQVINAAK